MISNKTFQMPSYFFWPEGEQNLFNSKKQKKAYPEVVEPKSYNLSAPDERIRKHLYETNMSCKEDSIVATGMAGTTRGGATFYLTSDPHESFEIAP